MMLAIIVHSSAMVLTEIAVMQTVLVVIEFKKPEQVFAPPSCLHLGCRLHQARLLYFLFILY
jgi:hypothetical protein